MRPDTAYCGQCGIFRVVVKHFQTKPIYFKKYNWLGEAVLTLTFLRASRHFRTKTQWDITKLVYFGRYEWLREAVLLIIA